MPNVFKTTIFYSWNLITEDEDDNKFVDCALNSNANLLVTQDNHFNILTRIDFPRIQIASIAHFKKIISPTTFPEK